MLPAIGFLRPTRRSWTPPPGRGRSPERLGPALCLVLCALGMVCPAAAEKTALVVVPVPGDTLHYRIELQQEVSFQGMNVTISETGNVHIVALESRQDTLQFSVRFSGFEGSIKRGEELMERKPRLDGVSLRALVSRRGEVLRVEPQKSMPAGEVEELQNQVDNLFPYLADHPVEPGDTWTQTRLIPNKEDKSAPPAIDGSTEFTLDEVLKKDGKPVAKILGKGSAKLNMPTPQGMVVGEVKGESELLLAIENGRILEYKSNGDFAGSLGTIEGSRGEYFLLKLQR